MTKIIPNGDTIILIKTRALGMTTFSLGIMPDYQYKIREGQHTYSVSEYLDGDVIWYLNGVIHRELGPAISWGDGRKSWYYHGTKMKCSSQEEFAKLLKLKAFW